MNLKKYFKSKKTYIGVEPIHISETECIFGIFTELFWRKRFRRDSRFVSNILTLNTVYGKQDLKQIVYT